MSNYGWPPPPTPAQPRRTSPWVWVLLGLLGVLVLCGFGAIVAGVSGVQEANKAAASADPGDPYGNAVASSAPPTPAKPSNGGFGEGDWNVGTDIQPGTYRTEEPVSGMCYWGIYRAGTNKGDIVENDIVTGGRPTVTLKAGQEFSSSGCGSWVKV